MSTNKFLTIDNELRNISVPKEITHIGVESDDKVFLLNFRMPRFYQGLDLAEFVIRINYTNANGDGDVAPASYKSFIDDTIEFGWLVGRFAMAAKGNVTFNVCLKRINGVGANAIVVKEFNTSPVTLPVLKGLETTEKVRAKYPDLVETWKDEVFGQFGNTLNTIEKSISSPYNFLGATTFNQLPTEWNTVNDTYYCTDKKCRYTWNGTGWFQSSLSEAEYADELTKTAQVLNALVYITGNGTVTAKQVGDTGAVKLVFDAPLHISVPEHPEFNLAWDVAGVGLGSHITVEDGKYCVTISDSRRCLSFDVTDGLLHEHHIGYLNQNRVSLIETGYGTVVGGALLPIINRKKTEKLETAVAPLPALVEKVETVRVTDDAYIYTASDGPIYMEANSGTGGLTFTFTSSLNVRSRALSKGYAWSDIIGNLSGAVVDGTKLTYTLGNNRCLVFNLTEGVLYNRNYDNIGADEISLLQNGWANLGGGVLAPIINRYSISAINDTLSNVLNVRPEDSELARFATLFNGTDKVESFMFFTDPHLTEKNETDYHPQFESFMAKLAGYYYSSPVDFCVCGGDWLGNSDSQTEACTKLGLIHSTCREKFDRVYQVVGNHDTNYQGYITEDSSSGSGTLSDSTIRNLWFRNEGQSYYSFDGNNTRFFVLDTGIEWDWISGVDGYKDEQYTWFADQLKANKVENLAMFMHIVYADADKNLQAVARNLLTIADKFNARGSISVNNVLYDFKNAVGKIHFVMAGHIHEDYISATDGGIPIVITDNTREGGVPTFDLCLIDYNSDKLHLVRVGTGENRVVNL